MTNFAKRYFESLFSEGQDAWTFEFQHRTYNRIRGEMDLPGRVGSVGGLGSYAILDKDASEADAKPNSYFMFEGSNILMPAVVTHKFYKPRVRRPEHPHYYWLEWCNDGEVFMSIRIDQNEDGTHNRVEYAVKDLVAKTAAISVLPPLPMKP